MPWHTPDPVSQAGSERGSGSIGLQGPVPANPSSCSPGEPERFHGQGCLFPARCSQRVWAEGSIQGCPIPDPATLQPHGAREADGFMLPAQMCRLSLPSLALTHFFLPLLSSQLVGLLSQAPNHPFPRQAQQHPLQTHFQEFVHDIRATSDNLAAKPFCLTSSCHIDVLKPLPAAKAGYGEGSLATVTGNKQQRTDPNAQCCLLAAGLRSCNPQSRGGKNGV